MSGERCWHIKTVYPGARSERISFVKSELEARDIAANIITTTAAVRVTLIQTLEDVAAPGAGCAPSGSALQRNPDQARRREREQAFDEGVSFGRNAERLRLLALLGGNAGQQHAAGVPERDQRGAPDAPPEDEPMVRGGGAA